MKRCNLDSRRFHEKVYTFDNKLLIVSKFFLKSFNAWSTVASSISIFWRGLSDLSRFTLKWIYYMEKPVSFINRKVF